MKEQKTVRFRVTYFDSEVQPFTVTADDEKQQEMVQQDRRFLGWLTDWQEAEVTITDY